MLVSSPAAAGALSSRQMHSRESAWGRATHCNSHICVRILRINGREFGRKIRKLGRLGGVTVSLDVGRGKGSHGRLYYGERFTTLKDRKKEIGPGLFKAMLEELCLGKRRPGGTVMAFGY